MNKIGVFLLTTLVVVGCGKNESASNKMALKAAKIVNGVEVSTGNKYTRHTVGLFNKETKMVCTGVIIEENLILTAAHCIGSSTADNVQIVFGNKILEKDAIKMIAKHVVVNEQYDSKTITNDVGLIRLPKKIPADYAPVDLEDSRQLALKKGDSVMAVGYGVTGTGFFKKGTSGILRMGKVAIDYYVNEEVLVGVDQTKDSSICFGDSGGPTFTLLKERPVLIGITSFVSSTAEKKKHDCSFRAYLSNPNYYYSWIQNSKLKI